MGRNTSSEHPLSVPLLPEMDNLPAPIQQVARELFAAEETQGLYLQLRRAGATPLEAIETVAKYDY